MSTGKNSSVGGSDDEKKKLSLASFTLADVQQEIKDQLAEHHGSILDEMRKESQATMRQELNQFETRQRDWLGDALQQGFAAIQASAAGNGATVTDVLSAATTNVATKKMMDAAESLETAVYDERISELAKTASIIDLVKHVSERSPRVEKFRAAGRRVPELVGNAAPWVSAATCSLLALKGAGAGCASVMAANSAAGALAIAGGIAGGALIGVAIGGAIAAVGCAGAVPAGKLACYILAEMQVAIESLTHMVGPAVESVWEACKKLFYAVWDVLASPFRKSETAVSAAA